MLCRQDGDAALRRVLERTDAPRRALELQQEQGPCLDAYRGGQLPMCTRIGSSRAEVAAALVRMWRRRLCALSALPMRLRTEVIGASTSSRPSRRPRPRGPDVAQALADIATIGILQERALHDGHGIVTQLKRALESRVAIEQAKGIVAERRRQRRCRIHVVARLFLREQRQAHQYGTRGLSPAPCFPPRSRGGSRC